MKKKSANRKQQKLSITKTETTPKPQEEQMLKGNDFQIAYKFYSIKDRNRKKI